MTIANQIKYYANFSPENVVRAIGVIVDGHGIVPDNTWTELTYEEYSNHINNIGNMQQLIYACHQEIDAVAGKTRLNYITSVPGQAETYLMKKEEADNVLAQPDPYALNVDDYPMIKSEMASLGTTDIMVATNFIIQGEAAWRGLAAAVEQVRRTGKLAVAAATDPATALNAKNSCIMTLQGI